MTVNFNNIRLFALDVDGVLTDGGVYISEDGWEFRRYSIKDGLGLKQVQAAGIRVVIISSSSCKTVVYRMQTLGISDVHLSVVDKREMLQGICSALGIALENVCYIGDDLPDLPAMEMVGLPCAPADAVEAVKNCAVFITQRPGGHGAVREVCDLILQKRR